MDYDDMLNQKRREENSYRFGVHHEVNRRSTLTSCDYVCRNGDPFVGGMKGSSSEGYLPQGNLDDSFNLGAGLSELTGAVRTMWI